MTKIKITRIFLIAFGIIMLTASFASVYYVFKDNLGKVEIAMFSDTLLFLIVGIILVILGKNWKKEEL